MPIILRSPGEEQETELPGFSGVRVTYRTPDEDLAKTIVRASNRFDVEPESCYDEARKLFGRLFVRVTGLGESGDETEEIEVDQRSGHLTKDQAARLVPITQHLWRLVIRLINLPEDTLGN